MDFSLEDDGIADCLLSSLNLEYPTPADFYDVSETMDIDFASVTDSTATSSEFDFEMAPPALGEGSSFSTAHDLPPLPFEELAPDRSSPSTSGTSVAETPEPPPPHVSRARAASRRARGGASASPATPKRSKRGAAPTKEIRGERKRIQNRDSARKYRQKLIREQDDADRLLAEEEGRQNQLKSHFEDLLHQTTYFVGYLSRFHPPCQFNPENCVVCRDR